jgi:chlorinating enzyme
MPNLLTEQQVTQYERDGYLFPLRAMDGDRAAHYRQALEAHENRLGGRLTEIGGPVRFKNHLLLRWVHELVTHPTVLDAIEDVIGPDILCYTSTFFIKEPNSPAITAWHQDATYFGLHPHEHVTAWIALSESSPESGCLEFMAGGKERGVLQHQANAIEHSVNGGRQKIVEGFDITNPVMAPLQPGEFSLHHTLCLHRSAPNNGPDRRLGLGTSYIPARVRHTGTKRMPAMLVRGEDKFGNFELEPPPAADMDEAAQAAHAHAYMRYRENYNEQLAWHESGQTPPAN